jgi:tRNA threonylcarbamoyladenosine biosynthesis protein TsaB
MIEDIRREAGVTFDQIRAIAVSDGPGSFTGLRIGWAAAKGLAHERQLPLYTAPSLFGAAFAAWRGSDEKDAPIAACYDALRGQVFAAVYRFSPGVVSTLVGPSLLTLAELARVTPVRPRVVVADGRGSVSDELYLWTGRTPISLTHPAFGSVAAALCELAEWPGAGDGSLARVADPATREPVYGRPAEAQVKWEARHGRPLPNPTGSAR